MNTKFNKKVFALHRCHQVVVCCLALMGVSSGYAAGGDQWNLPDLPGTPGPAQTSPVPMQLAQSGATQSGNAADPWRNPAAQQTSGPAVPPPVSMRLGDNTTAAFGASSTALQYQSASSLAEINAGIGYMKPDNPSHTASIQPLLVTARAATLFGSNWALGANLSLAKAWSEVVVNTAYRLPASPFFLSLSGGYARGTQNFDFSGVPLDVKLSQTSYVAGGTYVPPSESVLGVQSISLRQWGAQASQRTGTIAAPTTTMTETDASYIYSVNNYRLSLGRLIGASVGSQYALADNLVLKGALGVESVRYPFSDGTVTNNRALYRSVEALYEPDVLRGVVLGVQYKGGAAENRTSLSATVNNLSLVAFVSTGVNGTQGNRGVMLNYTVPFDSAAVKQAAMSLATRVRPASLDNPAGLLATVATRPLELPQVFLAKVDTTANSTISFNKGCVSPGVSISRDAMATVPIGPGPLLITGVTRDTGAGPAPWAYGSAFSVSGDALLLALLKFPAPVTADNYVATVTDPVGSSYQVYVSTTHGLSTVCATK